jgi:hypothetical protein
MKAVLGASRHAVVVMVIAAVAFMLRGLPPRDRRLDADGARR